MMNSSDFNGMDTKIERKKRFPFQVVLGSVLGCMGLFWMVFRDQPMQPSTEPRTS